MSDRYTASETNGYPETYRSEEYNSVITENYAPALPEVTELNSAAKSGSSSGQTKTKKTSAVTSGLLTTVGGVAGATVITATAVVLAALQITVLSFAVTLRSISVQFMIENAGDKVLTAYLSGDSGEYSATLEISDGNCSVSFDSLIPDTVYILEIKDEENNVYYSESYTTEAYFDDMTVSATETNINLEFYLDNPDGKDYFVGIDGCDEPRDYQILSGSGISAVTFDSLEPDRQYAVWIDDAEGQRYFYRKVTTPAISNPLRCDVDLSEYGTIRLIFEDAQFDVNDNVFYLNDQIAEGIANVSGNEYSLSGLTAGETYVLQIRDRETGELRLWEKVEFPVPETI